MRGKIKFPSLNQNIKFLQSKFFSLQLGLCEGSSFDTHYGWSAIANENSKKLGLFGFTGSILKWDENEKFWKISLHNDPNKYAKLKPTIYTEKYPLPIGYTEW